MPSHNPQLTKLFRDALELCEVTPDESVIVVSQSESRQSYVSGFLNAAESLGCHAESLYLPGFKQPMFPYGGAPSDVFQLDKHIKNDPAIQGAIKGADFIVDTTAEGLVHTEAREIALDNGARILTCWEPPAVLERMFPRDSLRERVEQGVELLEDRTEMRITSEAGTDIVVELGASPPVTEQYGFTDEPGRWDHLVSGFVACYPIDDSPNGTIVMDTGDVLLPQNRYIDHPIEFTVEDGFITEISGEGADTRLIKNYLSMWDSEDPYATSHFGWGLDENAVWETMAFYNKRGMEIRGMDNRSKLGSFMWSTGPNRYVGRDTRAHLDMTMQNCTIELDGEVIIDTGEVRKPELQPQHTDD